MIIKTKKGSTTNLYVNYSRREGFPEPYGANSFRVTTGNSTISYEDGPKYTFLHQCKWKRCDQRTGFYYNRDGEGSWETQSKRFSGYAMPQGLTSPSVLYPLPSANPNLSSCAQQLLDQIDLNCHESVLLYSGILQAVPLVGGAFKFTSLMNKAAKKLSRDFKRKPFWTVVKSMISLDFIDRFVISPTIDDARKFLNAHNYVVNVLSTMHERHSNYVCYKSSTTEVKNLDSGSRSEAYGAAGLGSHGTVAFSGPWTKKAQVTTETFALAKVMYQPDNVSALKLAATRYGVNRPLDSIWDLVPFSFVIDYFSRAGDFIAELGDKVSDQEGLSGKIADIHNIWCNVKASSTWRWTCNCSNTISRIYDDPIKTKTARSGFVEIGQKAFLRYPLPDAWSFLESVPDPSGGLLAWNLSTTRARTLLELFIQAKL